MLSEFSTFFTLGFEHICSREGIDHIVFVLVLCAAYHWREWRKIIVPVTGFTLGHSITLALSALDMVQLPEHLIETLIPITILITAIGNIVLEIRNWNSEADGQISMTTYQRGIVSTFFGLIHGLGFSYYFKAMLGEDTSVVQPLLAFNIGLEVGQLLIIASLLSIYAIILFLFKLQHRYWVLLLSGLGVLLALKILIEQLL